MVTPTRLVARVRAWLLARRLDDEFAAELDAHLELLIEDNRRRGLSPEEARRAALVRLGGRTALVQAHRELRGLPGLDTLLQDVRFALRLIARSPWFTAAAVLVIALGIGANTVGFTIVNAAFLRGFGFEQGDRLYGVSWLTTAGRRRALSPQELDEWRLATPSFAGLAAYRRGTVNVSDDRVSPAQHQGAWVSANHFELLRVAPAAGRAFRPEDERVGAESVAIIGDAVWRDRFDRDPSAIGTSIRVDGRPTTIVGVMPAGMGFPEDSEMWMPLVPADPPARWRRTLTVFGRLAAGASRESADAELRTLAVRMKADHPDEMAELSGVAVETFVQRYLGGAARPMFIAVMGAVVLVLLLACVNVANLMLSRSMHRGREIAVRFSMGATRLRVVRQLLVESILISCLGGALGLGLAAIAVRAFDRVVRQTGAPYWLAFTIDHRVLAYVAGVCVVTGVVFGLVPALQASSTRPVELLKDGSRGTVGQRRSNRFSAALVVAQLALAVVLLSGGGLLIRSFAVLATVETGVDGNGLLRMRLQLPAAKYASPDARRAFIDLLQPRVAAIPGVAGAAATTAVPPLAGESRRLQIETGPDADPISVSTVTITPEYFAVVGVPVRRGRDFTAQDGAPGSETVIVNDSLAARLFPGADPIGRRIRFVRREDDDNSQAPDPGWRTIVGVSGYLLQGPAVDAYRADVAYLPFRQESPSAMSLVVRSALPTQVVAAAVRREVAAIDPDQPVFTVQTLGQVLEEDRRIYGVFATLFGQLALVALVLASVGVYAVMAHAVTRRTPEVGLRMALGARRWQVTWLFLESGVRQLAAGLVLGVPAALALARLARFRLVDIEPTDPVTLLVVIGVLATVAATACLLPVRRATRVEPVETLRGD